MSIWVPLVIWLSFIGFSQNYRISQEQGARTFAKPVTICNLKQGCWEFDGKTKPHRVCKPDYPCQGVSR